MLNRKDWALGGIYDDFLKISEISDRMVSYDGLESGHVEIALKSLMKMVKFPMFKHHQPRASARGKPS